jgi:hypothetical protein
LIGVAFKRWVAYSRGTVRHGITAVAAHQVRKRCVSGVPNLARDELMEILIHFGVWSCDQFYIDVSIVKWWVLRAVRAVN